ncbi:LLM class flavin-dependent oxidoreductase [Nocardia neocaledoniensis]|uniref:LLM class flavin-dependent oxidoreductase n=1 Tax=Nocardia neocaledoniensis TaxID=236511 RepID=UPI002457FE05|nr:LLM class flavin-dependent oxidoreductase [Nocardia neocaledoniensis]
MRLGLRYDMRAPTFGAPIGALYTAAIEQSAWADARGFEVVHLAEHHGAEDNYCPSPLVLAGSIAARTSRMRIDLSAVVLPMHDAIRLAEDLAVLDIIAGPKRLTMVAAMGYRPHEFAMFGMEFSERARLFEEALAALRDAWSGEEFVYRERTVRVTPTPATPGGPAIALAGNAPRSARRAARLGYGYQPVDSELYDVFVAECERLGRPAPAPFRRHRPGFLHVTRDVERDFELIAPHIMHASNVYAQWAAERPGTAPNGTWQGYSDVDAVRRDPSIWIVTPEECLARAKSFGPDEEMQFHPLLGGLDPDISWRGLELFAEEVLPHLDGVEPSGHQMASTNTHRR